MSRWQRPTGGGRLPFLEGDSLSQEESGVGVVLFTVPDTEPSGVGQGGFPVSPGGATSLLSNQILTKDQKSHIGLLVFFKTFSHIGVHLLTRWQALS